MHEIGYFRVASMVQQFKAGMNSCNLFWEKVATDWHEILPLFTDTSVRLSRTVFRELFYVKWSAEGSNRRDKEEDTMYQWECLLMSIQGKVKLFSFMIPYSLHVLYKKFL